MVDCVINGGPAIINRTLMCFSKHSAPLQAKSVPSVWKQYHLHILLLFFGPKHCLTPPLKVNKRTELFEMKWNEAVLLPRTRNLLWCICACISPLCSSSELLSSFDRWVTGLYCPPMLWMCSTVLPKTSKHQDHITLYKYCRCRWNKTIALRK